MPKTAPKEPNLVLQFIGITIVFAALAAIYIMMSFM